MAIGCGGGSGGDGDGFTVGVSGPQSIARGQIATYTAQGGVQHEWTLISQPNGSVPVFDIFDGGISMASGDAGEYQMQLIATSSDGAISEPAIIATMIVNEGPQPVRLPLVAEVEKLTDFSIAYIKTVLRSPSTFQLVGSPLFRQSTSNQNEASLLIDFDAQNGFGAIVRGRAVCPMEWSSFRWDSVLSRDLSYCAVN